VKGRSANRAGPAGLILFDGFQVSAAAALSSRHLSSTCQVRLTIPDASGQPVNVYCGGAAVVLALLALSRAAAGPGGIGAGRPLSCGYRPQLLSIPWIYTGLQPGAAEGGPNFSLLLQCLLRIGHRSWQRGLGLQ